MESPSSRDDPDLPRASDLLGRGPFKPFLEFEQADISDFDGQSSAPSPWFESQLNEGKPFIIRRFEYLLQWEDDRWTADTLADLVGPNVDVEYFRGNRTGRMSFRTLIGRHDNRGQDPLYARDIDCPEVWKHIIKYIVSKPLSHLGPSDLAQYLPENHQAHVVMAHVGTRGSYTGFHWSCSGAVSMSLLIESKGPGPGSIWFGTDRQSYSKYDQFLESMGKSPHRNWDKLTVEQLRLANFPIYVAEQNPGDLVVFPSGAPHQTINLGKLVSTVAWNIMHESSVSIFKNYLEPIYNQIGCEDIGRVPLVPMHTLQRVRDGPFDMKDNRRVVEILLDIFALMVYEERLPSSVAVETISPSDNTFTCNFCNSVIWNRHLHCAKCPDVDLCFRCFIAGRSCKSHYTEYSFRQLMPWESCISLIRAIEEKLHRPTNSQIPRISLGELATKATENRRNTQLADNACHMCNCRHKAGLTIQCTKCPKVFCLRSYVRHYEIDLIPFLREWQESGFWECPCCTQKCRCSKCHFPQAYQPVGKYLTCRAKIPDGMEGGFIDVTAPLGPKRIHSETSESPRSARKRPRLEERSQSVNSSRPTRRTRNSGAGTASRNYRFNDSASGDSSRERNFREGIDYIYVSGADDSDSSDEHQSTEIKDETSSPIQVDQQARNSHSPSSSLDPSWVLSRPPRHPVPANIQSSSQSSAASSNSAQVHDGPFLPDSVPEARSQHSTTHPEQPRGGDPASTRNTAARPGFSSSVNRSAPAMDEPSAHQSTTGAADPPTGPVAAALPTPPDQTKMNPMGVANRDGDAPKMGKLQWLRKCAEFSRGTPVYEMTCAEIAKTEEARAIFESIKDFPHLVTEFQRQFQVYLSDCEFSISIPSRRQTNRLSAS